MDAAISQICAGPSLHAEVFVISRARVCVRIYAVGLSQKSCPSAPQDPLLIEGFHAAVKMSRAAFGALGAVRVKWVSQNRVAD